MPDENEMPSPSREGLFSEALVDEFNQLYGDHFKSGQFFGGAFSPLSPQNEPVFPTIPGPTAQNIISIVSILKDPSFFFLVPRDRWCRYIESVVMEDGWLEELASTFRLADESGSETHLFGLFDIIKHVLLFSTVHVLLRVVQDDYIETLLGMLEHDPDIPKSSRVNHRELIRTFSTFNRSLVSVDSDMVNKIHKNFRLQYVRDSVLARMLDDGSFLSFSQAVGYLNSSILTGLLNENSGVSFIEALTAAPPTRQSVTFLYAVVQATRQLTFEERGGIMAALCEDRLFAFIENAITTVPLTIEVLLLICSAEPQAVRSRATKKASGESNLFTTLISALHKSESESMSSQIAEVLRTLLEPSIQADFFISSFYETEYIQKLADPLISSPESISVFTSQTILDLLTFCVSSHNYIAKAHFLRFGALLKYIRHILTLVGPKTVQLAAIRLVRAFFWQKDPMYFRHLSAFNIPCLILQLLYLTRPSEFQDGNMIYSATLEILTFVCVNAQLFVIEALCKPESESERIVLLLNEDSTGGKAHSELAQFMLAAVDRLRTQQFGGSEDDCNSRQSISSSRGRSQSPKPLVVPMPVRRTSAIADEEEEAYLMASSSESEEEEAVPKTPIGSPHGLESPSISPSRQLKRRDSVGEAPAAVQPPAIEQHVSPQPERKRMRFSTNRRRSSAKDDND